MSDQAEPRAPSFATALLTIAMLWAAWIFVPMLLGWEQEDIEKRCHEHRGVASVETRSLQINDVFVICRDGTLHELMDDR